MAKGDKLSAKQELFITEFLVDLNATQSAIRAGYSKKNAETIGWENLRKPKIAEAIQEARQELADSTEITPERVLREYGRLGFLDPRKFFREDGSPKDITELDDDTAAALAGFEVMEVYEGSGDNREFVGHLKKYRLADKRAALDSISKTLGTFIEKREVTGKNGGAIQTETKIAFDPSLLSDEELALLERIITKTTTNSEPSKP